MSLEGLVERAQARDRNAFSELFRAYVSDVSRYVGSMLRDTDRAEDVVAETFLLAWRDLPKLRAPERFAGWLFRIAHHRTMSELRRRPTSPLEEAPEREDESVAGSPAGALEAKLQSERLGAALQRLSEEHRQVLVLRFLRGLSHAEVAEQLGRSEQATRALQYRALARMRRLLGAGGGERALNAACVAT